MNWKKQGIVFNSARAQLPVVTKTDESYVCLYSERDVNNRSFGSRFDFKINNNKIEVKDQLSKLIEPSELPGSLDHAGCMPMQIVDGFLYYIGWTLRQDVPYFNYTSICEFVNGKEPRKIGPILSPDIKDTGFSGTIFVLSEKHVGRHLGYYLSADHWTPDENGNLQPCYDIKIAESPDLLNWTKLGKVAISRIDGESGISSSTVIKYDETYHMWFSVRSSRNFRGGSGSYIIKHATSTNAIDWVRTNKFGLYPNKKICENMCSYPSVFIEGETLHMFYNSYNFGEDGISHATMPLKCLEE